jgi:hypothetical protein
VGRIKRKNVVTQKRTFALFAAKKDISLDSAIFSPSNQAVNTSLEL